MQFLITALNWLVYSSKDKNKFSLTLRGFVPLLVFVGMLFGVNMDEEGVSTATGFITDIVAGTGAVISACVSLFGLIRKFRTQKQPPTNG